MIGERRESHDTPTPSDGASSVYSQPGLDHAESALSRSLNISAAAISTDPSSHEDYNDGGEQGKRRVLHTRGGQSCDVAHGSFFVSADAKSQHLHDSMSGTSLTNDAEDIGDFLALAFGSIRESDVFEANNGFIGAVADPDEAEPGQSHPTQRCEAIERVCRQRVIFEGHLKTELKLQKESLEAAFDKCYDTSDRLHEIDLLNLNDDHTAELRDVQEERDAALAEVKALTTNNRKLNLDVQRLDAHVLGLERLVEERTEERESFRCQAKFFWEESNELLSELGPLRLEAVQKRTAVRQERAQLAELTARNDQTMSQLTFAEAERDAFRIQNTDLAKQCQDVCTAYEDERKEKECIRRQLTAIVDEKGKDFSWHMRENNCHLALKSEDPERAESNATAMAQELHKREAEKVLSLRARIAELDSTTEAGFKKQEQIIERLSEEASVNAMALEVSLNEQKELAKMYQELLMALGSDRDVSELARGLAHDLQKAFEERALFGLALIKAEQELVKSDHLRKAQVCDLKDIVQDKEDEALILKEQVREAESKAFAQDFVLEARDDEIQKTVPELKDRIAELELIMEERAMSASQYQTRVITDLKDRMEKHAQIAAFYEHHFVKTLFEMDNLKTEWSFYLGGTVNDVQLARSFRDQRDVLNIECLAMRERFADELLVQPLVVPETLKTRNEIEEEQLEDMHQGVLKQFLDTYKALPKWLVQPGCPGYEVLRVEVMNAEREKMEREREAIDRSFLVEGEKGEGDDFVGHLKEAESGIS